MNEIIIQRNKSTFEVYRGTHDSIMELIGVSPSGRLGKVDTDLLVGWIKERGNFSMVETLNTRPDLSITSLRFFHGVTKKGKRDILSGKYTSPAFFPIGTVARFSTSRNRDGEILTINRICESNVGNYVVTDDNFHNPAVDNDSSKSYSTSRCVGIVKRGEGEVLTKRPYRPEDCGGIRPWGFSTGSKSTYGIFDTYTFLHEKVGQLDRNGYYDIEGMVGDFYVWLQNNCTVRGGFMDRSFAINKKKANAFVKRMLPKYRKTKKHLIKEEQKIYSQLCDDDYYSTDYDIGGSDIENEEE